jgi:hypothetical protein
MAEYILDQDSIDMVYGMYIKDLNDGVCTIKIAEESIKEYEAEEDYEACAGIKKALDKFKKQNEII